MVVVDRQYSTAYCVSSSAVAGLRNRSVSLGVTIADTFGNRPELDLRPSLLILAIRRMSKEIQAGNCCACEVKIRRAVATSGSKQKCSRGLKVRDYILAAIFVTTSPVCRM